MQVVTDILNIIIYPFCGVDIFNIIVGAFISACCVGLCFKIGGIR